MYAPAWMRAPRPTVVSFSISDPRPRMPSSASITRSRMQDWSPTMQFAPITDPANTIAPVEITVPAPIIAGGSGSRLAVDRAPSVGCCPTTAYSKTRTPSPRIVPSCTVAVGWTSAIERRGEHLERTHDARSVAGDLRLVVLSFDQLEEKRALEAEGLGGGDLRNEDVPGVQDAARPGALLVDRHLALRFPVVEHGHLLSADHRQLAHLVR